MVSDQLTTTLMGDSRLDASIVNDMGRAVVNSINSGANSQASLASAATFAQYANTLAGGLGVLASAANAIFQTVIQYKMLNLQLDYQQKMFQLQDKALDLQQTLAEIQERILDGKNDLIRDLAKIEADVAKYQARMEKEKSVENTKTMARYGHLNDRFYGRPAFPA